MAARRPPWLVDRMFRHLLVDMTGNTHRAEFCIDKLYSPDTATGRLGLVEFRAFEMPPHARMSLTQQLLLRTLVAWFWRSPIAGGPFAGARSCTIGSCCRTSSGRTFSDVIDDLQQAGYAIEADWFLPHLEFRFPVHGRVQLRRDRGRAAAGDRALARAGRRSERPAARCATSIRRSSGCKCESPALTGDRYVLTCNGRRVPLASDATQGEYVGRRALSGLAAAELLAPHDSRSIRRWCSTCSTPGTTARIGGCTYHVAHPGGLQLRDVSRQRHGGGGPPRRPLLRPWPHTRARSLRRRRESNPEFPLHARSATRPMYARGTRAVYGRVAELASDELDRAAKKLAIRVGSNTDSGTRLMTRSHGGHRVS